MKSAAKKGKSQTLQEDSRHSHDHTYVLPHKECMHRILRFEESVPSQFLGPHYYEKKKCWLVHAYLPMAVSASVRIKSNKNICLTMRRVNEEGIFQAETPSLKTCPEYLIEFSDEQGRTHELHDPYAFSPDITDFDLYLMAEGTHYRNYTKLGAILTTIRGVAGVQFAVWAPHAVAVSVVGDFNHWMAGVHPMERLRGSCFWGLFVPGLETGILYKFAVKSPEHSVEYKSDPLAFAAELRPKTASVVADLETYKWNDEKWIHGRSKADPLNAPLSIYECHLGSWRRKESDGWGFLNYRELAHEITAYVKEMGYTHIELMPVMEHPLDESWGYQITGYYAPTSRFGSPQDFMYFVDYCHLNGIGVILDWVPGHFPRDGHGLARFDGREIYAYGDWKKGEHKEWGTLVFDYGRNEVRNFLISNALFWIDKYHVDGLRVDAVASMLYLDYDRNHGDWEPNCFGGRENLEAIDFLKKFNETVHAYHPGVLTIAEESTAWGGVSHPTYCGGLGFSLKWNMGWMHDTLEYIVKDPIHRKYHQNMLTFSLLYAFTENFILPISHDEVVHGKGALLSKMPGDDWQKFANQRLFFAYMFAHPGKKLNFMTNDIGQWQEWRAETSADWHLLNYERHRQVNRLVRDLNRMHAAEKPFHEVDFRSEGFEWIDFMDAESGILAFVRWARDHKDLMVCTFNLTPVPRLNCRIGVPWSGFYEEIMNTDALEYGGSGTGNWGGCYSDEIPWHHRPCSLNVNLPPLAGNFFRFKHPESRPSKNPV